MLKKLGGLSGNWEGTYEWSGGRTGGGRLRVTYYVTGNESAVVENFIQDGVTTMTTVYHLDGSDLRMTHYCGAMNQPRLRATSIDETSGTALFAFVDVTNVTKSNPAYVQAFRIQIVDDDHLRLRFTFGSPDSAIASVEEIALSRVRSE